MQKMDEIDLFLNAGSELGFISGMSILQLQSPVLKKGNCHIYFDKKVIKLEKLTKYGILRFKKLVQDMNGKSERECIDIIKNSIKEIIEIVEKYEKYKEGNFIKTRN